MTEAVTVEQIDREAAAAYMKRAGWCVDLDPVIAGTCDMPIVQAFAAHRLASQRDPHAGEMDDDQYAAFCRAWEAQEAGPLDQGWEDCVRAGFAAALSTPPQPVRGEDAAAAERERCARIAENPGFIDARDTEFDEGVNFAKRFIAAAIRKEPS